MILLLHLKSTRKQYTWWVRLEQWFLMARRGETFLIVTTGRRTDVTYIVGVEARGAAKHLIIHKTTSHNTELFSTKF